MQLDLYSVICLSHVQRSIHRSRLESNKEARLDSSSCKSQRAATCPVEVPFMPRPQRSLPVKVSCLLALSSKNAAIVSRLSTSSHHELLFFEVQQQAGGGNPPGGLNMSLG